MQAIDLTHIITKGMPVFPGTSGPFLRRIADYGVDGFRETELQLTSHTGTHMDAPAHLYPSRTTLDALPVERFFGRGLVVDCRWAVGQIGMEHLAPVKERASGADFLLFWTGWDVLWGKGAYFRNYPCLDFAVIDYLIKTGKKGIGLDTPGIDPTEDETLPRHKRLFAAHDIVVVENLCHLGEIGAGEFFFAALPLKFEGADGAPVRAVALRELGMIEESDVGST